MISYSSHTSLLNCKSTYSITIVAPPRQRGRPTDGEDRFLEEDGEEEDDEDESSQQEPLARHHAPKAGANRNAPQGSTSHAFEATESSGDSPLPSSTQTSRTNGRRPSARQVANLASSSASASSSSSSAASAVVVATPANSNSRRQSRQPDRDHQEDSQGEIRQTSAKRPRGK